MGTQATTSGLTEHRETTLTSTMRCERFSHAIIYHFAPALRRCARNLTPTSLGHAPCHQQRHSIP